MTKKQCVSRGTGANMAPLAGGVVEGGFT
jgi:hypothetical protein